MYDDARGRYGESGPLFLHPDDDLAPNRPGENLHARLSALAPRGRAARAARALGRLAGRPDPAADCRRQLDGQQLVGAELEMLTAGGWMVLHSLPLPSVGALSHLLIGPGGVFALHTAHHRGAQLYVGLPEQDDGPADSVRIGRARTEPYVRLARRAARTAELALGRACGFSVEVCPVVALVGAHRVTVAPGLDDVRVVTERTAGTLGQRLAVLKPDGIAHVYAVARDRRTWLGL